MLSVSLSRNNATQGGGIYSVASTVNVDQSQLLNNRGVDSGGAPHICNFEWCFIFSLLCTRCLFFAVIVIIIVVE